MKKDCFTSLFYDDVGCVEELNDQVQDYVNEFIKDYGNVRIIDTKLFIDDGFIYKDITLECWE